MKIHLVTFLALAGVASAYPVDVTTSNFCTTNGTTVFSLTTCSLQDSSSFAEAETPWSAAVIGNEADISGGAGVEGSQLDPFSPPVSSSASIDMTVYIAAAGPERAGVADIQIGTAAFANLPSASCEITVAAVSTGFSKTLDCEDPFGPNFSGRVPVTLGVMVISISASASEVASLREGFVAYASAGASTTISLFEADGVTPAPIVNPVPEPSSAGLTSGLGLLIFYHWRRRRGIK